MARSVTAMHSIEKPAGSEPAIQVTGLVKTYGHVRAVDGVSFQIRRGETFLPSPSW